MPSQQHEALVHLFRQNPQLGPKLLGWTVDERLPTPTQVKIESADLTELQPTEYRADLVLSISNGRTAYGLIVEVQLSKDPRKHFTWPAYVASLRARWECPVCLLVVCPDEAVAGWASMPIRIGCENVFVAQVIGPAEVPEVLDAIEAELNPELAVLSVMAHGRDADVAKATRIAAFAQGATARLDPDRSRLYLDLVMNSVSEAVRRVLAKTMLPFKYEYQSEFAKHYVAEGLTQGRAALVIRQLTARFGVLAEEVKEQIEAKSIDELDAIGERLLAAMSLEAALTPRND